MPTDQKQQKQRNRRRNTTKRTYIHRPNAVCVTLHSQDGSPVPRSVLNEATSAIWHIAHNNNLLINIADT